MVTKHVHIDQPSGQNAVLKVLALVAGMGAGADSIEDMGLLRHGAVRRLFTGVRAPSTLGTFLRTFTFGHVRQLDAVASRILINLCRCAPLLPGADTLADVNVEDTVKPTFGYAKQGAGGGYTGVKGLNVLLALVSTPTSRPVIAAARLRKGSTNSAKGAHRFVADPVITAKKAGATGSLVLRRLAGLRREGLQPDPHRRCARVVFHAKATTGAIRAQLIHVPGRLARSARHLALHLPVDWPWRRPGRRWPRPSEKDHPRA